MINLNVFELDKIKKICEEVGTEYFTLEQTNKSGVGSILTMTYDTFVADHPAKMIVEVTGVETW
jgi:hypothetical protein